MQAIPSSESKQVGAGLAPLGDDPPDIALELLCGLVAVRCSSSQRKHCAYTASPGSMVLATKCHIVHTIASKSSGTVALGMSDYVWWSTFSGESRYGR